MFSVDKAHRLSISIVIWILSSDTIYQLNQLNANSEATMLSLRHLNVNPTRYPVFISNPTRFSFENYRVVGNPKYGILPRVLISNRPWNTRKDIQYTLKYPEISESKKKMPENTPSLISTLLPDPNPTRYPVFFLIPTWPDPILEKTLPLQKIKTVRITGFTPSLTYS